jgi:DNA polymerase
VFGEGRVGAPIMLVGEQPGDVEDRAGRPFVGPAGKLLATLLADARVDKRDLYLTNAVKHFGFEQRGKHRLHKKPSMTDVVACRPWLQDEVTIVRPRVVVALGATAAAALFGPKVRLTRDRGQALDVPDVTVALGQTVKLVTYHPAAALRAPTPEKRKELRQLLTRDLALASRLAGSAKSRAVHA